MTYLCEIVFNDCVWSRGAANAGEPGLFSGWILSSYMLTCMCAGLWFKERSFVWDQGSLRLLPPGAFLPFCLLGLACMRHIIQNIEKIVVSILSLSAVDARKNCKRVRGAVEKENKRNKN